MARPEIKAMFLDDMLNGSRKQLAAPFYDVVAFARDWGFWLDEVEVPVRWWHGDADHIVPFAHGEHVVSRLPDAERLTERIGPVSAFLVPCRHPRRLARRDPGMGNRKASRQCGRRGEVGEPAGVTAGRTP